MKSPQNARLFAISGPAAGTSYLLDKPEITVGRDPGNSISFDDATLSDVHFAIFPVKGRCRLVDRNSRNGIWINGDAHLEKILVHGDRIECGTTTFLYWEEAEDPETAIIIKEERTRNRRLETLRVDYSSRAELTSFYRSVNNVFLSLADLLDSISDTEEIKARVLDCAFEIMPTFRGGVFLNGSVVSPADFAFRFFRERESGEPVPFSESSKLVRRVYQDRSAHFDNEIPGICAPLITMGMIRGVIYMEGGDRGTIFEPEHLGYLRGIAGVLVAALKLSREIETNREDREILRAQVPMVERKIIGETPAIQLIFTEIDRAARTNSPVLITGENGTGKEMVARRIHTRSSRAGKPFIALNCAGLSDGTVQSELFGHEKGAFTGAVGARKGRILAAQGGTLFLDEIGDLKMEMQGLLLRFLQEGTFEPLGSDKTISADVRIIAATNVDLPAAIAEGKFREDLYYRLKVFPIRMPALRERMGDLDLLANYFLDKYGAANGFTEISPEALDVLHLHDWPGNVRELENAMWYAVDHGDPPTIEPSAMPANLTRTFDEVMTAANPIEAMTKIVIERMLVKTRGDKQAAADRLGISISKLYRLLNPDSK